MVPGFNIKLDKIDIHKEMAIHYRVLSHFEFSRGGTECNEARYRLNSVFPWQIKFKLRHYPLWSCLHKLVVFLLLLRLIQPV